jgi:hypothetical protein
LPLARFFRLAESSRIPPSMPHALSISHTMDAALFALTALVLGALCGHQPVWALLV